MSSRPLFWFDMDGVLCDFRGAIERDREREFPQSRYGFFETLEPLPGAIEGYRLAESLFNVRILTKPSEFNINSYSGKAFWVYRNLGFKAQQKMVISGDKSLLKGDVLVDDELNANQADFEGLLIRFGQPGFENWEKLSAWMVDFHKKLDPEARQKEIKDALDEMRRAR